MVKKQHGFSTIEILIATSILVIVFSAVILLIMGSQKLSTDTQTAHEAQLLAEKYLESARNVASSNFGSSQSATAHETIGGLTYDIKTTDTSFDCYKNLQVNVVPAHLIENRPLSVDLATDIANPARAFDLGGDCSVSPPGGGTLSAFSPINLGGAKTNGLDVLNKNIFIALQNTAGSPGLYIVEAQNPSSPNVITSFSNGFNLGSGANAIDTAQSNDGSKVYAYIAKDANNGQFCIIDVSTHTAPSLVGSCKTLNGTNKPAYRIRYYKNKVYVGMQNLDSGPELHVFDVSNPASPTEYGSGFELGEDINDIVLGETKVNGNVRTVAFLAVSNGDNQADLSMVDVTNPSSMSLIRKVSVDNLHNGLSLDLNRSASILYLGTSSKAYVFDVASLSTTSGPNFVAQSNASEDIYGFRIAGNYGFSVSSDMHDVTHVWNISSNSISLHNPIYSSNNRGTGVDYENGFVYVSIQQGNNTLMIYKTE